MTRMRKAFSSTDARRSSSSRRTSKRSKTSTTTFPVISSSSGVSGALSLMPPICASPDPLLGSKTLASGIFPQSQTGYRKRVRLKRQERIIIETPSDVGGDWIGVAPLLDVTGTARILACKAANISSAMLAGRRRSSLAVGGLLFSALGGGTPSPTPTKDKRLSGLTPSPSATPQPSPKASAQQPAMASPHPQRRESLFAPAEGGRYSTDNIDGQRLDKDGMDSDEVICCMGLFELALKFACLGSMVSVCLHTPQTIAQWPSLQYWLLVVDLLCTAFFTFDATLKIDRYSVQDRWVQFDLALLVSHYFSVVVHCIELLAKSPYLTGGVPYADWYGMVRAPRPFIVVRLIRSVLRFKLPQNRIQIIIKRSSQQIQNVTIFFLFFMTLYAIMGVQLFGRMEHHCVRPGTDPKNVTIADLAIPDTMCSPKQNRDRGGDGYECPPTMRCMKLVLSSHQAGFYGMFGDFASSLFTVYMSASQEGWVYVLYDTLDTFPSYIAFCYFITLIFFLAWLVKNVFIAVLTETFAEIRVQFSEIWQTSGALDAAHATATDESHHLKMAMKLGKLQTEEEDHRGGVGEDGDGGARWVWKSVAPLAARHLHKSSHNNNDESNNEDGQGGRRRHGGGTASRIVRWLRRAQRGLRSGIGHTAFQTAMFILVLVNALINASFVYRHNKKDEERRAFYYSLEVGFTALFAVETVAKIVGYGWTAYARRGQHKFELLLTVGSALNVVPSLYPTSYFTYFQVFRLIRLVKISPMLEDFVYKILGPSKKLGALIVFVTIMSVVTAAVSLQLFCFVPQLDKFRAFPQALMTMFQIMTQEGWTEVVVEILRSTNEFWVPFVAIYFVGYHLFVTLIVLSLFVAVILDNLEMDEELKKIKQLKAREETTCMRTTLPWRLRIFEHFPTRPQMVELRKVSRDFPTPKVRDSFTRQFFDVSATEEKLRSGGLWRHGGESLATVQQQQSKWLKPKVLFGSNQRLSVFDKLFRPSTRQFGQKTSQNIVNRLIQESNRFRVNLSDSVQHLDQPSGMGVVVGTTLRSVARAGGTTLARKGGRSRSRSSKGIHGAASAFKSLYGGDHLKENGDLRPTDAAPKAAEGGAGLRRGQPQFDIKALQRKRAQAEFTRTRIEEEMRENHPYFDRPLFFIGRDSRLRKFCQRIVARRYQPHDEWGRVGKKPHGYLKKLHALFGLITYLDWAMVLVTACSCGSMLLESPWPTTGENLAFNNPYLKICDYVFVLAMSIELTVKIISDGLIFTPNALVRDVGGAMTIFIYLSSLWYLLWMPSHVEHNSLAQLLMIFRAMRPLRIYTLVPHIRHIFVELCGGFREILLVTILLLMFMFMFASFGLQLVGGKLAACNDPTISSRENCTGIFEQRLFVTRMEVYGKNDDRLHPKMFVPRVWTNPRNFNFDHIGNAMLALFETLSYKGWNVIRDILWKREGPWAVLFIHIYVFIGCMIGLTLFVTVVIANYMENRGTALLTVDQRRWNDLKARLRMAQPLHVPPKPGESARVRNRVYGWTISRLFKQFYAVLVVLNSATLVVPWNVEEEENRRIFLLLATLFSAICILLFTGEMVLKATAYTVHGFWQSRRNRIDLLITVLGLAWTVVHFGMAAPPFSSPTSSPISSPPTDNKQLRRLTYTFGYMTTILRFFTIVGRKTTLKMLMLTVVMSMVRSAFIIAAMFLLVLFYAYAGVILFGMVRYGQAISKHVNFRSGRDALVVLFRSVTGEDWNDIMHDCMRAPPFCYWRAGANYWQTDCGNYFAAIIYFCSFYLIITYIVLNLLVAIIIENFSLFYSSEEDALLSYADIRNYQMVWNMIDVCQKRVIPVRRVKFLLRLLKGRLEVDPNKDRLLFKHMCREMERLNNGDDVSFHDILKQSAAYLSMLSYRSVDIRKSLRFEELVQREELEFVIEEEVAKLTIRQWLERCLRRIKTSQHRIQRLQSAGAVTSTLLFRSPTTATVPPATATIEPFPVAVAATLKRASMNLAAATNAFAFARPPNSPSVFNLPTPTRPSSPHQKLLTTSSFMSMMGSGLERAASVTSRASSQHQQQPQQSTSSAIASALFTPLTQNVVITRKVQKRLRSSSIPELFGEAKRFVWGGRKHNASPRRLRPTKSTRVKMLSATELAGTGTGKVTYRRAQPPTIVTTPPSIYQRQRNRQDSYQGQRETAVTMNQKTRLDTQAQQNSDLEPSRPLVVAGGESLSASENQLVSQSAKDDSSPLELVAEEGGPRFFKANSSSAFDKEEARRRCSSAEVGKVFLEHEGKSSFHENPKFSETEMSEDVFAVSDDRGGSPSSEEEQGLPLEEAIEQWWSNEIGHHEIY